MSASARHCHAAIADVFNVIQNLYFHAFINHFYACIRYLTPFRCSSSGVREKTENEHFGLSVARSTSNGSSCGGTVCNACCVATGDASNEIYTRNNKQTKKCGQIEKLFEFE